MTLARDAAPSAGIRHEIGIKLRDSAVGVDGEMPFCAIMGLFENARGLMNSYAEGAGARQQAAVEFAAIDQQTLFAGILPQPRLLAQFTQTPVTLGKPAASIVSRIPAA